VEVQVQVQVQVRVLQLAKPIPILEKKKNVCSHKNETQQHQQHLAKCFQIPKRIFK
jgi:hypothetical protein